MEMTLDQLDVDDDGLILSDPVQEHSDPEDYTKQWMEGYAQEEPINQDPEPTQEPQEDDLLSLVLESKGINPEAIKIRNEEGLLEEVSFSDLTREEQLDILTYNHVEDDYGLDDEESRFLEEVRKLNLSPKEYLDYYVQQSIEAALSGQPIQMEVDQITDDELYIADLKSRIPDLTEDEALQALEHEKSNSGMFDKKMQSIREEYRRLEEQKLESERAEEEAKVAEMQKAFENDIITAIQENSSIDLGESELEWSENDMDEVASFILDEDAAGVRYIAKALNDPKTLVEMAWYALKGREAISQISDYYKNKITESAKYNYEKGYEDAKKGNQKNTHKTVVAKKTTKSQNPPDKKVLTIDDLD